MKGNHKSASGKCATILATKLAKEVNKGWCIPILPNHALKIPNLEISPLGLTHQASINEQEEIIDKDRVTHELSLPRIASETSINEQMDRDKSTATHYGHMHKQLVHSNVNIRENYPFTKILIRKDDFKSAYRQQHLSAQAKIQSSTQINYKGKLYVLISLILAFGGANGPAKCRTISEPISDLGNALLLDDTW